MIEYDVPQAEFTEYGTKAHPIVGNPLLVFYWPKVGRTVFFRSVNWKPGPGVAANKGWFSKEVSESRWRAELASAIRSV